MSEIVKVIASILSSQESESAGCARAIAAIVGICTIAVAATLGFANQAAGKLTGQSAGIVLVAAAIGLLSLVYAFNGWRE